MKIAVYNRYWRTGGGAETYGAAVAQVLARHPEHTVDRLGPDRKTHSYVTVGPVEPGSS